MPFAANSSLSIFFSLWPVPSLFFLSLLSRSLRLSLSSYFLDFSVFHSPFLSFLSFSPFPSFHFFLFLSVSLSVYALFFLDYPSFVSLLLYLSLLSSSLSVSPFFPADSHNEFLTNRKPRSPDVTTLTGPRITPNTPASPNPASHAPQTNPPSLPVLISHKGGGRSSRWVKMAQNRAHSCLEVGSRENLLSRMNESGERSMQRKERMEM